LRCSENGHEMKQSIGDRIRWQYRKSSCKTF